MFMFTGTSNGHTDNALVSKVNSQRTIFDVMNDKNKTWRVYYTDTSDTWYLERQKQIFESEGGLPTTTGHYRTIAQFTQDAKSGELPAFTYVEPGYTGAGENDYHPDSNVLGGEQFIADVYNAVRSSPLWEKTLLIINFDENGGFYDPVSPPFAKNPVSGRCCPASCGSSDWLDCFFNNKCYSSFSRTGFRVPLLLISPYSKSGNVDHTTYDHTSIPKTIMTLFNIDDGSLGPRTGAAKPFSADNFNGVPNNTTGEIP
jgi:phospholipase C